MKNVRISNSMNNYFFKYYRLPSAAILLILIIIIVSGCSCFRNKEVNKPKYKSPILLCLTASTKEGNLPFRIEAMVGNMASASLKTTVNVKKGLFTRENVQSVE